MKTIHHRTRASRFRSCCPVLVLASCGFSILAGAGESLDNGIVLPDVWPSKIETLTRQPLAEPPYLKPPPQVIPIDVGRQLFVDDFRIERTTLKRTHHQAE